MAENEQERRSRELLEQRALQDRIRQKEEMLLKVEIALVATHTVLNEKNADIDALLEQRRALGPDDKQAFWDLTSKIEKLKTEVVGLSKKRTDEQHDQFELWREVCELHETQRLHLGDSDTGGSMV